MAFRRVFHPTPSDQLTEQPPGRRKSRRRATAVAASLLACSIPLLGVTAAHAAPIDGGPSIGDSLFAGIGNTGYDVQHYDVKLNYVHEATPSRAAGSVVATTTITAIAAQELGSFSLDFEHQGVDAVTVNGAPATFTQSSDKPTESYKLTIQPAASVTGEFTVVVEYSGNLPRHYDNDGSSEGWVASETGVIALGQPVGTMAWLPSNNTPADKATFDIALTIPTEMNGMPAAGVSNGELVSSTPSADGTETTWAWKQLEQQATMSTMLGIGNYDVYEDEITLLDGRVIPEWTFVDSTLSEGGKATTETRRQDIQKITQFLESKYGPYPGNSTGFIVHRSNVGYALETQDRSYFPGTPSAGTFVHEIAHQWFGAAVTPNDWNNIWISEGQATYASTIYTEEVNGGATSKDTYFNTWNNIAADDSRWQTPTAAMTDQVQLFDWQSYTRGAMTYEALRQVMGDDLFFEFLTEWIQTNNGTSRSSADFIALAEAKSGKDLTAFFQDWLYDADKPAWPSIWSLGLSADPADGVIAPGDEVTYTLDAMNDGQVPLAGTATVDLAGVLDDASLDASALDPSLTLDGTTLTWAVPAAPLTESTSVEFTVQLSDRAYGATLDATASGSLGATCDMCAVTHTTEAAPAITDEDLTEESRGEITLPETAVPGDTITIGLGSEAYDGTNASATLFSAPVSLGSGAVANGEFQVQIPASATLGAHRVAVTDSIGLLVGWGDITLVAAPVAPGTPDAPGAGAGSGAGTDTGAGSLSNTGSDASVLWIAGGAASILLAAGATLLIARKRAAAMGTEV
ncbi:MAG: M1 family aminopeptidase [Leucobacter sp.]